MPIVYFVLPETKNLGLEQVQSFFTPAKTIFYIEMDVEKSQITSK